MSEEPPDTAEHASAAPAQPQAPPVPDHFQFPIQLLEEWVGVPTSERINASLTRQDIDHLLFGMLRSADAQTALEATLVHWSNGRTDEANKALMEFRRLNVESQNHVRQFFTALMVSALQGRRHGG
jgi:hypothetical protein